MPVRRVIANDKVENDRGRVALLRGPLVFCVEGADVPGGKVNDLVLPDEAPLASEFRSDLLGGVQVDYRRSHNAPANAVTVHCNSVSTLGPIAARARWWSGWRGHRNVAEEKED